MKTECNKTQSSSFLNQISIIHSVDFFFYIGFGFVIFQEKKNHKCVLSVFLIEKKTIAFDLFDNEF